MLNSDLMRRIKRLDKRIGRVEPKPPGNIGYAEGTFVPTYLGATTAGVTTYTTQVGFYRQFGPVVFFSLRVIWTAATGTGIALISLPFTSDATTNMRYTFALRTDGVTFANNNIVGRLDPANNQFQINSLLTNAAPTAVNIEAAGDIIASGFYFTSSGGGGGGGGGGGTVTSVGLTMPAEFSVAGSPVTTSGTLAVTKANENANTVWAGPTSGAAAQPTFRALVAADILDVLQTGASGVLLSHFFNNPNGTASGGQSGLEFNQNSGGGYTVAPVTPPTTDAIGVLGIASNAASGVAFGAVYTSGPGTNNTLCFGGMALDLTWRFRINALPASGQDYILIIGFVSARNAGTTPANGAFMWLDFAAGFTDFRYRTRVASVSANAGSGLTAAIDTWYKLRIQVDTSSNCIFTIDGANSQTLTGPSGTGQPLMILAQKERVSGTNNRILYLDYARLAWSGGPA